MTDGFSLTYEGFAPAHICHILQESSRHTADMDAGMPPRGLNGGAHRGHVFWDELDVSSVLTLRHGECVISPVRGVRGPRELDRDACRERYGDIQRLDRIGRAERTTQSVQGWRSRPTR